MADNEEPTSVSGEQQEVINDEQEVINNEQEIINVEPVGEGEGSGGVVSDPLAAAGESPVDGDEQGAGQEELKGEEEKKAESTQEGAVGGTPKFGRFRTSKADEAVDLLMGTEGVAAMRPETIPSFFHGALKKNAGGVALKVKREGEWRNYTFQQYWDTVVSVAKSYLKVGLEPFHGVCIIGFNAPEWFCSSMGAIFAGGLSVGIYPTNSPEACQYILDNCKANVCVVENQKQLDKILQIWERLPHLKVIIQYTGKLSQRYNNVYEWEEFLELGNDIDNAKVEDILSSQQPSQCAVLVYTSGTTGPPKGVMLSHDNLVFTTKAVYETYPKQFMMANAQPTSIVSYLPLSHIAGMIADMYFHLGSAGCVWFAQPDALKGTLVVTLKEAQPNLFFGVPRVWEKMMERMKEVGASITGFKRTLADWAKRKGLEGNQNKQKGESVPWGWTVANMLVHKKVHTALGLNRAELSIVGSAPVSPDVLDYFMSVNIPILEVYGMSENTGPHTINRPDVGYWRSGSVGRPVEGMEVKIGSPDENGEGEILMRGRDVFMGYLGMEDKTVETIDDDRWLHSGDIGKLDKDGFLYVTGRIKELIITAGGENIPPVPIENAIKASVPFLSNVMVVGDKRKYLTCLVTLKCVVNLDTGEPTDELLTEAKQALAELGCNFTTVSEVRTAGDEKVHKAIMDGLKRYNETQAISNAQKVQKYYLLESDFSVPGGELGPTLKLKRFAVVKKFAEQIESMYSEA